MQLSASTQEYQGLDFHYVVIQFQFFPPLKWRRSELWHECASKEEEKHMDSDTGTGIRPPSYVEVNRWDSDIWKCICRHMGHSCHCESYIIENADAHAEGSPFFLTLQIVSFCCTFLKHCTMYDKYPLDVWWLYMSFLEHYLAHAIHMVILWRVFCTPLKMLQKVTS